MHLILALRMQKPKSNSIPEIRRKSHQTLSSRKPIKYSFHNLDRGVVAPGFGVRLIGEGACTGAAAFNIYFV